MFAPTEYGSIYEHLLLAKRRVLELFTEGQSSLEFGSYTLNYQLETYLQSLASGLEGLNLLFKAVIVVCQIQSCVHDLSVWFWS